MLPLQSYSTPETTTAQYLIALVVLLALGVALLLLRYRAQYQALPTANKEHKARIQEEIATQSARIDRFETSAIRDESADFRRRVRALVENSSDRRDVPTTTREGVSALNAVIRAGIADALGGLPATAVKAGQWALLLLFLALPVVLTQTIRSAVSDSPGYPSPTAILDEIASTVGTVGSVVADVIGLFPGGGFIGNLAFAYGILLLEWLYDSWYLLVAVLVLVAVSLAVAHTRGYDTDVQVWLGRRGTAAALVGAAILVWIAGVVPTALGRLVGLGGIGAAVGLLAAVVVAIALAWWGIRAYRWELRQRARPTFDDAVDRWQKATILVSRLGTVLIWVTVPVTVAYAVVGIISGDYWTVTAALFTAPLDLQVAIGFAIVAVIVLVALVAEETAQTARTVLQEVGARQAIRVVTVMRGFPFVGAAIGFLGFQAILGGVVAPAIGGILVGLVLVGVAGAVRRARYRARLWDRSADRPRQLVVAVWTVRDADETERFVAELDGERIAAPDADGLVEAIVGLGTSVATDGSHPRTLEHAYYDALVEVGITDFDRVVQAEREKCRKAMLSPLRAADDFRIDREDWDEATEDVARSVREQMQSHLQSFQVLHVGDDTVAYRPTADPWRDGIA